MMWKLQQKLLNTIVILVAGSFITGCSLLPLGKPDYDLPEYKVPDRPQIEVGRKFPAKEFLKDNKNINLDKYIIESITELKKDTKTRERLKIHIKKLEKIIEACSQQPHG